ncbi:hypothetical protein DACRYDRAFT_25498 [Dacryopinax primogenitus]|uniref:Uncharacterized protein n=1 Tax=Dacryopinax primogenitus (strain DJM 731) TaxID=1858805 RepID=M5FZ98_DACPD|nr:uncharacterized protein DACRYDRAFT_25498 [Dacryopinax primogenitus]EJT96827.1 hypothetical protein DACRYDRAFT_25498 [Dacryopinax primogenitus]
MFTDLGLRTQHIFCSHAKRHGLLPNLFPTKRARDLPWLGSGLRLRIRRRSLLTRCISFWLNSSLGYVLERPHNLYLGRSRLLNHAFSSFETRRSNTICATAAHHAIVSPRL